jgi:hypothetical protein
VRVNYRVVDGKDGRVIFANWYEHWDTMINPNSTDVVNLMHNLRAATVDDFAKVILPWQEVVNEKFEKCDGDDRCKVGFNLAKNGDFQGAEAQFTQAIGAYESAQVPPDDIKRVSEAFYNRGLVRAYTNQFEGAVADLKHAIALAPKKPWNPALQRAQGLANDHRALAAQGAQ